MFCPKCGNELRKEAKFCNKCGNKVSAEKTTVNNPIINVENKTNDLLMERVKILISIIIIVIIMLTPFLRLFNSYYVEYNRIKKGGKTVYSYKTSSYYDSYKDAFKKHDLSQIELFRQLCYRIAIYDQYIDNIDNYNSRSEQSKEIEPGNFDYKQIAMIMVLIIVFIVYVCAVIDVISIFKNYSQSKALQKNYWLYVLKLTSKVITMYIFFYIGNVVIQNITIEQENIYTSRSYYKFSSISDNTFSNFNYSVAFYSIFALAIILRMIAKREMISIYHGNVKSADCSARWVCNCGTRNSDSQKYCGSCGKRYSDDKSVDRVKIKLNYGLNHVEFDCPKCSERLSFEKSYYNSNNIFECPHCKSIFRVKEV